MGKGNGSYYINPSPVMNGHTCKVGRGWGGGWGGARGERTSPALNCSTLLSTFSVQGGKYDIFCLFGTVNWSARGMKQGDCKFKEIN